MPTVLVPNYTGTLTTPIGGSVRVVDGRGEIEDRQADYFRSRGYRVDADVDPLGQLTSGAPPARNASRSAWESFARSRGVDVTDDMGRDALMASVADDSPFPLDPIPEVQDEGGEATPAAVPAEPGSDETINAPSAEEVQSVESGVGDEGSKRASRRSRTAGAQTETSETGESGS